MSSNLNASIRSLLFHLISILISALFLLPLLWMLAASLRQPGLPPPQTVEWLPKPVSWSNYIRIFDLLPIGKYLLNSIWVSLTAVALTLLTSSLAGFGMSQLSRQMRGRLILISVVLMLIPLTAIWLARFILYRELGIFNSHMALIFPSLMGSNPLFILLFYWSFRRIPAELFETARMDGANAFSIWWRVALPLSRATLIVVGILAFLLYWGDFASPLFYLKSQSLYTLPIGVRQLQEMDKTNWPLLMAGTMLMTLPTLILFAILQRFFLQENVLSGIYGR
ncbi:MAG TPA: carbohydrate ABC transporter permease [Anaerolineales bacterium]|nr:carbohydrate ABC transporter permease [Anaerolineales bacterium]